MLTNRRHAASRVRLALLLGTLLAALALPAPAAAGQALLTTFGVELYSSCVWGEGPANTELTVRLKGANGSFQGKFKRWTDGDGFWEGCFLGDVQPGDVVSATDGSTTRSYTVQPTSFKIDRVTDVVSGTSVPNDEVFIFIWDCNTEWSCQFGPDRTRPTSGNGAFTTDFTGAHNIRGGDFVEVHWFSPQGDDQYRSLGAPRLEVWVGNNSIFGQARPRQTAKVWLLDSNGTTQRGRSETIADIWDGDFYDAFQKNGRAVDVEVGDWLVSNIASDVEFQVPNFNQSLNPGSDQISFRCFKNRPFEVYVEHEGGDWMLASGHANRNGLASLNTMDAEGFDLESGDSVDVACLTKQGDVVEVSFEVP